jgi:hypothetical protein
MNAKRKRKNLTKKEKKKTNNFKAWSFEDGSTMKNFTWVVFEDLRMKFHFVYYDDWKFE